MTAESSIGEESLGQGVASVPLRFEPFDYLKTVISQYANSPVLLGMIEALRDCLDPAANFAAFFDAVWNIDTAQGYGLDIWGRIVGVSRVVYLPVGNGYFGFKEALPGSHSFGESPFYGGAELTTNFELSDNAYRRLIFAKALANISDGSIASINAILRSLFSGYGNCYVIDNRNMTMVYHFGSTLSDVDYAIVTQSGALPRPVGVSVTVTQG